ncbi:MAG TPA: MFS transporter [Micromonosporaceae bacterium]
MIEQVGPGTAPAAASTGAVAAPAGTASGDGAQDAERPLPPLYRNRKFATFWTAQVLSHAGSQVTELAVPLTAVLVLSATPVQMGLLTTVEALPSLVVGVLLGVLVDRVRRGPFLIWCNLGQAVVLATIPVAAWLGLLTFGQLLVVMFIAGSLALGYALAQTAYLPALVDRRQLTAANSSVSLSDSVTSVAGPGLGGALVQLLTAPIAVLVDVASFLVSALLQLGARRPEPPPAPRTRLGVSVREGFAAFRRHPGVLALTVGKGTFEFFHWGVIALSVLFAIRELGLSPAGLGVVGMLSTLGPLLAGAIASPVNRRWGTAWTSVVASALLGGNLLIPFADGPTWARAGVLVVANTMVGLGAVYLIIVRATMVQQSVPSALLGRVTAAIRLVEWGPGPLGALAGGFLGQALGLRPALFILGAGCLLGLPWIAVAAGRGRLGTDPVTSTAPA